MNRFMTLTCLVLLTLATAASAATLRGKVVNGTSGGPGTAERIEIIDVAQGMTPLQTMNNITGSFEMINLPDAAAAHFLLNLTYNGITSTQRVPSFDEEFEVMVYESTESSEGLTIARHHVIFGKDPDHYQVTEFIEFDNQSNPPRAIVAEALAMRLMVNHDIHGELSATTGTSSMPVRVPIKATGETGIFGVDQAAPPGISRIIVRYLVHYTDAPYTWQTTSLFPTNERRVLVTPTDIGVNSEGMISTEATGMDGYAAWVGLASEPGDTWTVTLSGGSVMPAETGQQQQQQTRNSDRGGSSRPGQEVVDVVARPNRLEAKRWPLTLGLATFLLFATLAGIAGSKRPKLVSEPDERRVSISKLADRYVAGQISREEYEKERDRLLTAAAKPKKTSGAAKSKV